MLCARNVRIIMRSVCLSHEQSSQNRATCAHKMKIEFRRMEANANPSIIQAAVPCCLIAHTQTHSHTGTHTQGIHSKNILVCWKGSSSQHVHRPSTHSVQKPYACQLVCCSHPCDWRTTVIEDELITNAQKIACHRTHLNTNWATNALFECVYWGNDSAEGRRNYHLSDTTAHQSGNFLPMRAPQAQRPRKMD